MQEVRPLPWQNAPAMAEPGPVTACPPVTQRPPAAPVHVDANLAALPAVLEWPCEVARQALPWQTAPAMAEPGPVTACPLVSQRPPAPPVHVDANLAALPAVLE